MSGFFPAGGGGGSGGLTLIQTQKVTGSPVNALSFTGIPASATANHIWVIGQVSTNRAGQAGGFVGIQYNGDTGANYFYQILTADNAVVSGSNSTANSAVIINTSGALGTDSAGFSLIIPNYQGNVYDKAGILEFGNWSGGSTATEFQKRYSVWANSATITRIDLTASGVGSGQLTVGSMASVYLF